MAALSDGELRDLILFNDGIDDPIRVRDIECIEVPLSRIRAVVDRLGLDSIANGVLAQVFEMGMLAPMMAYVETGDEGLLEEAVDIRLGLELLDSEAEQEEDTEQPKPKREPLGQRKLRHAEARLRTMHGKGHSLKSLIIDLEATTGRTLTAAQILSVLRGQGWPPDASEEEAMRLYRKHTPLPEIRDRTGVPRSRIVELLDSAKD